MVRACTRSRPLLRKIGEVYEGSGKVRLVGITDWWTQALLRPLHKHLFKILKKIPQDGTFNQTSVPPVDLIRLRGEVFSFDLTAATDRLPVLLQSDILYLIGIKGANS